MKRLILLLLPLATISCSRSNEDENSGMRDTLYYEVCALTRIYADSMSHATDSATVKALNVRFEARLQAVYMKYPPASDQLLTEDLNDTIYILTRRFVDAKMKALAPADTAVVADTVPTDKPAKVNH